MLDHSHVGCDIRARDLFLVQGGSFSKMQRQPVWSRSGRRRSAEVRVPLRRKAKMREVRVVREDSE